MAKTEPPVDAFHDESDMSEPTDVSTAARYERLPPPIEVKFPPTIILSATSARALTPPLAFGFHGVIRPLVRSTAARLFRVTDPVEVKSPPVKRMLPYDES